MTLITMCTLPFLDLSYANVIDFKNEDTRQKYFDSRLIFKIESNVKYDSSQQYITINKPIEDCDRIDYLHFRDKKDKQYFYFITNKIQVNQTSTKLEIELDVWQTYLFSYDFLHSFIERSHVNRWSAGYPIAYTEDEGLDIGEYVQIKSPEIICSMEDSIVITSSVPIGKVPLPVGGGGEIPDPNPNPNPNPNPPTKFLPSKKGYRFVKGYEGFAPTGAYFSGESFKTAGYGITENYQSSYYQRLLPFPCSEKLASEVYGDMLIAQFANKIRDRLIKDNVNQSKISSQRFDVLCSLGMNTGLGNLFGSTLWKMIVTNIDDSKIAAQIEKSFITSNGNVLQGLVLRRKAESNIWKNGVYEMRKILKYNNSGGANGYVTDNNGDGYIPPKFDDPISPPFNNLRKINNQFGKWTCPTKGTVTALYPNYNSGGYHRGNDIANMSGTDIYAMRNGTVIKSGTYTGGGMETYGKVIFIEHGSGLSTRYAHNSQLLVKVGDKVVEGQVIAKMGTTGNSTGNHLHFEVLKNSEVVNPSDLKYMEVIK
ncbi:MAG: peptidoglycan DD-metalloendopeptidase family protein [Bacilli bacterium]